MRLHLERLRFSYMQELKDKGTRYLWYLGLGMLAALVVY